MNSPLRTAHNLGKPIKKEFSCNSCIATFDRRSVLEQHKKAVHDKIKDNSCNGCNYRTSYRHDLKRHMKMHEKPVIQSFKS